MFVRAAALVLALAPAAAAAQSGPVVVLPLRPCSQVAEMCRQNPYGPCNLYVSGVLDALRYRDVATMTHRQRICLPPDRDDAANMATIAAELARAPPSSEPAPVCIEQTAQRLFPCPEPPSPAPATPPPVSGH